MSSVRSDSSSYSSEASSSSSANFTSAPAHSRKRTLSAAFTEESAAATPIHKRKRKRYASDKAAATERRRIRRAARPPTERAPSAKVRARHTQEPLAIETVLNALNDLPVTSTGYIGRRTKAIRPGVVWEMGELIEEGFEVLDWDGM